MVLVIAGLGLALVPFHQPGVNGGLAAGVPPNVVDCGVPLRTAFRKLDPIWSTSFPGAVDWHDPRPPDPACKTPARRRTLVGAFLGLAGLSLLYAMLRRSRSGTASNQDTPASRIISAEAGGDARPCNSPKRSGSPPRTEQNRDA